MSAQPPDPSLLPQHTDTSEQHDTEPPESTSPPHPTSNSLSDSSSTDRSTELAVKSGEKDTRSTIFGGIGKIILWCFFGSMIIVAIIAGMLSKPTQGPEFENFLDQYFWKIFVGVTIVAVAVDRVSLLLTRRREQIKRRELVLTERVKALQITAREAQEVSRELERYLKERLAALEVLNKQTRDKEKLAGLTRGEVQALDQLLHRRLTGHRRSGLIEQVVFLLLAFALGFIVNWLSDPVLDELRRWWTS